MDKFAVTGPRLGEGLTRCAHVSAHWPDRVVKHAYGGDTRDNDREALLWRKANRNLRKYLARVYAISADGKYLLMQRTSSELTSEEMQLLKIPARINHDAHRLNFGKLPDGRVVMHDYAGVPDVNDDAPRVGTGRRFEKLEFA